MDFERLVEAVYQELACKLKQDKKQGSVCVLSHNRVPELERIFKGSSDIVYFSKENYLEHDPYKMVLIPRLTVTMLANLANGIGTTVEEQFILYQLLQGQKVIVLQNGVEHREYKKQSPALLYKVYEEYEKKLKGFGVFFLYSNELLKEPKQLEEEKPEQLTEQELKVPCKKSSKITKRVISEADLQKIHLQNIKEITISDKSIITPLAKDFIRTHHLVITHQGRELS